MARYIDADKLIAHLKDEIKGCEIPFGSRANGKSIAYGTVLGLKSAISFAETLSTADVVPKSEEGAECPICHGTGRIGTTDWLIKNISEKQLAEKKAQAIAEHESHVKTEIAREIFEEIENNYADFLFDGHRNIVVLTEKDFAKLKKKYTEGNDA